MKIHDILASKGRHVRVVNTSETIHNAIRLMAKHNIGSLMVLDEGGSVLGIVTERDCLREVARNPHGFRELPVSRITTTEVVIVSTKDNLSDVMRAMHGKNCRHVPVMEHGKLQGMISVRDVIRELLNETEEEVKVLREYVAGPGA